MTLVTPRRFNSRMKCRVELAWYSGGSFGPFASVAYRSLAFGLAINRPVGLPCLSRWISPPGGLGVSFVYPTAVTPPVQDRPVVEVQDENRRVRRGSVDLIQRRHPALGELKLGPAADDAHPLRGGVRAA